MSKPVNFSYSNTLTSTQQPIVKQKGTTTNTGPTMSASSNGVMSGFSRPNVNVGHIGPGESPMNNLYEYNLNLFVLTSSKRRSSMFNEAKSLR